MKTKHYFRFALVAFSFLVVELACLAGLAVLRATRGTDFDPVITRLNESQRSSLRRFIDDPTSAPQDPELGWEVSRETNSAGMRDHREYETIPSPGTLRLAAFGDSFTRGMDVELKDSWAKQMVSMDPSLEVLNYGVGGYGLDQAYLRYRKRGREYSPHVVLIGFMSENIARNVNVHRAFYTSYSRDFVFTKPRFVVRGGELTRLPNPIATVEDHIRLLHDDEIVLEEIGKNDYHYQSGYQRGALDVLATVRLAKMVHHRIQKKLVDPIFRLNGMYDPNSEAYEVTLGIFDAFYRQVLADGALPIVLIFPDINDQQRSRKGKPRRYGPLLSELKARGYRVIDVLTALQAVEAKYELRALIVNWGHLSALGNRLAASHIYARLNEDGLLSVPKISTEVRNERSRLGIEDLGEFGARDERSLGSP